jgi:predicted dehydrogenase
VRQVKVGVVGYGYWGPNLVRNFSDLECSEVLYICDLQTEQLERHKHRYKSVRFTSDYQELLNDKELDAIVITTPVETHFKLAKQALLAGKHALVSKPMCRTSAQCAELIAIAEERDLVLMVDHTFVYHGPVRLMKELIDAGELGNLLYFSSVRDNLGLFQHDVNVIWDLAVHDLSIMDYLINRTPTAVHAIGRSHTATQIEDIAFVTLEFEDDFIAHFQTSWLSPVKIRQMMIGGSKKMLVFDDHKPIDKICVYDKGIELLNTPPANDLERYRALIQYRSGDMRAPVYDMTEALKRETLHFVDCVLNKKTPITDGHSGLRIVKLLEFADASLSTKSSFPLSAREAK